MNEYERVAKILTRPIQPAERQRYQRETNVILEVDDIIRIKEAVLELAESVEYLKIQTGTSGDIDTTPLRRL